MKFNKKQNGLYMIALVILAFFTGCEFEGPVGQSLAEQGGIGSTSRMFVLQYEEQSITTSYEWPENLVYTGGLGKAVTEDMEYLVNYSRTHCSYAIDDSGYISFVKEWLEGNADLQMPEEMWEQVEDLTHPIHPSSNPPTRIEFLNGVYNAYGEDGSIIRSSTYDAELLRVNPSTVDLDSFTIALTQFNSSSTLSMPISEIMASMSNENNQVVQLGDQEVMVEQENENQSKVKYVVNSSTGVLSRSAFYNQNEQLELITKYSYSSDSGISIPIQILQFRIGDRMDGARGVLTKTLVTRSNLNVSN